MARNVYFNNSVKSEQDLYEDLVVESIGIYGQDLYYIPRTIIARDLILNEDVISKFTNSFKIEMYIESVDGFEGDGKLVSKFGLEIRDQVSLLVSRKRWNSIVGRYLPDLSNRPREGDLIYFPMAFSLFEIKFVEDKKPFYQLGYIPTYKIVCELFEYSNQDISTGVDEVDDIQRILSEVYRAYITFPSNAVHNIDDMLIITLPSGITGTTKLLGYEKVSDGLIASFSTLSFNDGEVHALVNGTTLAGPTVTSTITRVIGLTDGDNVLFKNDAFAQNSSFENTADVLLDFSESNPFGE